MEGFIGTHTTQIHAKHTFTIHHSLILGFNKQKSHEMSHIAKYRPILAGHTHRDTVYCDL